MKKVDIITLHRLYNYGSVLQAYATQKVFEKHGCDTSIIDYVSPERTIAKIFLNKGANPDNKGFCLLFYRIMKIGSIALKQLTFGSFVKKQLNLTRKYIKPEDLEKAPPKADIYVTGSDQTWNSQYNKGIDRGYYLDFLPDEARRVAFVASFGQTSINDQEKPMVIHYLKRYSDISVREDSAKQLLEGLGIEGSVHLIDPTLQLEKREWLQVASKRLIKEPYVILMLLYNEDNGATEYARSIANDLGIKLVKISWEMKKPQNIDILMTHRSPSDFLSLFYFADFVVTNSFHGTAFSINMEKQFVVVPRSEFNTRIESLLRVTELQDRLIKSKEELSVYKDEIDYSKVNSKLAVERQKADAFISNVLLKV